MKKIIAISVMLALVAGAVFADTSVGGNMKISTGLLAGGGDDVMAGGITFWDIHTNVQWSGENAGGMMRLWSLPKDHGSAINWTPSAFAFWWWKPIDQLRVQLGKNADADWGHPQIPGWGFNAEAQGGIAVDQHRGIGSTAVVARTAAWWGGFGDAGLAISIFPAQGFEIDLGIPMGEFENWKTAAEIYMNSKINFNIGIPDIGNVRLAANLIKANKDADQLLDVHFAFYLSAIEGQGIDIGAAFKSAGGENFKNIEAALGYRFNAEDLTIKARLGFLMPDGGDKIFGINILPSYNVGSFVFYFNAGFGMNLDNSDVKDWYVNPYIRVPAKVGNFYAGIKLIGINDNDVTWEVPIGWNVYF
jgi:hypothetical protein